VPVSATRAGASTQGPVPGRALLVSSFVRPHRGGVEEFVDSTRILLEERGWQTRTLACRLPAFDAEADAVVPTRFLGRSSWPLPTGGWRTLWREVGGVDVVIVNGTSHLLPLLAVFAARARRRAAIFVLHGSGEYPGSRRMRVGRSLFQRALTRPAIHLSHPVSASRAGVHGARKVYGVEASYVPFPVRALPMLTSMPSLGPDETMNVTWVGRLFPEKDPLLAVEAVEVVRRERDAVLHVCGDGPLRRELGHLAKRRPWLVLHGAVGWDEAQALQGKAHACLATSVAETTHLAVLEALCRGIPTVSTWAGDAPTYYNRPAIRHLCVGPRTPEAVARALLDLADSYVRYRGEFAANAAVLRARHAEAGAALASLAEAAIRGGGGVTLLASDH
jgi:glycosyltransferase involved in cell wall biosynthesis